MTKTIVVGGHARNVGKTSLAAAIIESFQPGPWTAVKISSHWHEPGTDTYGGSSEPCRIDEEQDRHGGTDTARYLAAGASRSFRVRIRDGRMPEALPRLMPVLRSSPFVLIESNGIVRHIRPDLFLMVLKYDIDDFKQSAREAFPLADAVVLGTGGRAVPVWKDIASHALSGKPVFPVADPRVPGPDLLAFIRARILSE